MTAPVERKYAVGIGEMVVTDEADAVVQAHGLGSCVALIAHCPTPRVGGMAHIMLPASDARDDRGTPARFADTGIPRLLEALQAQGANLRRTTFSLVGGASVLSALGSEDRFKVGERNAEAAEALLRDQRLQIAKRDVGGTKGRSVEMEMRSGRVLVRTVGQEYREL